MNEDKEIAIQKWPPAIMAEMAKTYEERAKTYGNNWLRIGAVLQVMFGDKPFVPANADEHNMYHLFLMVMVKMTRFAETRLTHEDSVHDAAVYLTMAASLLSKRIEVKTWNCRACGCIRNNRQQAWACVEGGLCNP